MSGPHSSRQSLTGYSFGNFQVAEQLGAGGMGVVYRAVDQRLGRSVALKFLSSIDAPDTEARERFLREARAASALDHRNVGVIHSIDEGANGELWIVMAYYDGETVAQRIARGPLPVLGALQIAIQTADGVAEAHSKGILHRDVKPSNVMITRTGEVKVVDFGLAKLAEGGQTVTRSTTFVGTAAYMSPEQVRGLHATTQSDIWSLGAVLYEMLTGSRPFGGIDTYAILYAIVHDPPAPLQLDMPEVERVLMKALEKEPANRYGSMAELAGELRRIMAGMGAMSTDRTHPLSLPTSIGRKPAVRMYLRRKLVWVCGVLLLCGTSLMIPAVRNRVVGLSALAQSNPAPITVAVLPFTSPDDPATVALAGGFAEALSGRISQLERFAEAVSIVRSSELVSRNIKNSEEARKLVGATMAVTGVIRRTSQSGLQLALEFRDSRRTDPVRIDLDEPAGDARSLEDRAAAEISGMLDIRSNRKLYVTAQQRGGSTMAAYDAYLRGLGYLLRWDKPENVEKAIAAFGEATRADAKFAPAYVGLAKATRTQFRMDKDPANLQHSLHYGQQAVELDPKLADAHVVLGRTYQETESRDLAVLEFQKALDLDPRNTDAIVGMGRSYEDLHRYADAENAFKKAVSLNPYAWSPFNNLANFYFRRDRFEDAEAQFRRALALTPDNAALHSNLGVVLRKRKKLTEAIGVFRRSIELEPSYAAYLNLGNLYYQQHDFRQAAEAYDRALQQNSKDFLVWGSKGQALRLSHAPPEDVAQAYRRALKLLEEGLRVNSGQARALSLAALYYACVGDRTHAAARIQQALTRANSDGEALINVAAAYDIMGQRTDAVRWAREALAKGYPWEDFRNDPDLQDLVKSGAIPNRT